MMADYSKGYTVAEDRALDELKEVIVKKAKVRRQILKSKEEMENCKLVVKYNDEKYFEKKAMWPLQNIPYPEAERENIDSDGGKLEKMELLLKAKTHCLWIIPIGLCLLNNSFRHNNVNPEIINRTMAMCIASFFLILTVEIVWSCILSDRYEEHIEHIEKVKEFKRKNNAIRNANIKTIERNEKIKRENDEISKKNEQIRYRNEVNRVKAEEVAKQQLSVELEKHRKILANMCQEYDVLCKRYDDLWKQCGIEQPSKGNVESVCWCLDETQLIMRSCQIGAASAWVKLGLRLRDDAQRREENLAIQKVVVTTGKNIIETIQREAERTRDSYTMTQSELINRLETIESSISKLNSSVSSIQQ